MYHTNRRTRFFSILSAVLVLAMAVSFAMPGTSQAAGGSETEAFGPAIPDYTRTLTFNQFECPDAQTPLFIRWEVLIHARLGQLVLDNDGVDPGTADAAFGAKANLSSMDVVLLDAGFQPVVSDVTAATTGSFPLEGNVGDGPGDYDPTPPDGAILFGTPVTDTQSGDVGAPFYTSLVGYIGTGTFDVDVDVQTEATVSGMGGIELAYIPATAEGTVTLSWDCPAPLAVTLASNGASTGFSGLNIPAGLLIAGLAGVSILALVKKPKRI